MSVAPQEQPTTQPDLLATLASSPELKASFAPEARQPRFWSKEIQPAQKKQPFVRGMNMMATPAYRDSEDPEIMCATRLDCLLHAIEGFETPTSAQFRQAHKLASNLIPYLDPQFVCDVMKIYAEQNEVKLDPAFASPETLTAALGQRDSHVLTLLSEYDWLIEKDREEGVNDPDKPNEPQTPMTALAEVVAKTVQKQTIGETPLPPPVVVIQDEATLKDVAKEKPIIIPPSYETPPEWLTLQDFKYRGESDAQYKTIKEITSGGEGLITIIEHKETGKKYVIKSIDTGKVPKSGVNAWRSFAKEIAVRMFNPDNPHIPKLLGIGVEDIEGFKTFHSSSLTEYPEWVKSTRKENVVMLMEYVDDPKISSLEVMGSLSNITDKQFMQLYQNKLWIKSETDSHLPDQALVQVRCLRGIKLILQACDRFYRSGLAIGDFNAQNMFLTKEDSSDLQAKLIDFGHTLDVCDGVFEQWIQKCMGDTINAYEEQFKETLHPTMSFASTLPTAIDLEITDIGSINGTTSFKQQTQGLDKLLPFAYMRRITRGIDSKFIGNFAGYPGIIQLMDPNKSQEEYDLKQKGISKAEAEFYQNRKINVVSRITQYLQGTHPAFAEFILEYFSDEYCRDVVSGKDLRTVRSFDETQKRIDEVIACIVAEPQSVAPPSLEYFEQQWNTSAHIKLKAASEKMLSVKQLTPIEYSAYTDYCKDTHLPVIRHFKVQIDENACSFFKQRSDDESRFTAIMKNKQIGSQIYLFKKEHPDIFKQIIAPIINTGEYDKNTKMFEIEAPFNTYNTAIHFDTEYLIQNGFQILSDFMKENSAQTTAILKDAINNFSQTLESMGIIFHPEDLGTGAIEPSSFVINPTTKQLLILDPSMVIFSPQDFSKPLEGGDPDEMKWRFDALEKFDTDPIYKEYITEGGGSRTDLEDKIVNARRNIWLEMGEKEQNTYNVINYPGIKKYRLHQENSQQISGIDRLRQHFNIT